MDGVDLRGARHRAKHQSRTTAIACTRWIWQHSRGCGNGMNETPKLWPHAWSLIRGQQRVALVGLVLTLFSIAASLLQPWPLKIIVDSILGSVPMPASLAGFADNKPAALLIVCLALLVINVVRGGLGAWGTTYLVRGGLRMTQELRFRVYEHLQKLSLVFHASP